MKSELSVRWPFFVNFCRYIGYFKKLTWFPSVTYLGLQTGKVWAIFRPWPRCLWFLAAITLNLFRITQLVVKLLMITHEVRLTYLEETTIREVREETGVEAGKKLIPPFLATLQTRDFVFEKKNWLNSINGPFRWYGDRFEFYCFKQRYWPTGHGLLFNLQTMIE